MKSSSITINSSNSSLSDWLQKCENFIKIGVSHIILNRSHKQQNDPNGFKASSSFGNKETEIVNISVKIFYNLKVAA